MRWKAQLVVLGLNGRIRRTPGYAGGYLFAYDMKIWYNINSGDDVIYFIAEEF